jgi:hypothetical protein
MFTRCWDGSFSERSRGPGGPAMSRLRSRKQPCTDSVLGQHRPVRGARSSSHRSASPGAPHGKRGGAIELVHMRRTTKTGRRSGRRSGRCRPFSGDLCRSFSSCLCASSAQREDTLLWVWQMPPHVVLWAKDVPKEGLPRRCQKSLFILPYRHVQNCSAIPEGYLSAEELGRRRIIQLGFTPLTRSFPDDRTEVARWDRRLKAVSGQER